MKRTLTLAAMLTLSTAAFMPLPSMAQADVRLIINAAPPAPRFESVPAPRRGYVWAPGYWNWDGQRHVWNAGHWESARDGYQYQRSEWVRDANGYRLDRGGWQRVSDRNDRDGRYDRNYVAVQIAPPAPRYERTPRARRGYIWEPGHWVWNGNRHNWVAGKWLRDRPGYVYSRPTWVERDGRWYMEQSRWDRRGRDRDRDGIPDRMERRDTDRDGVPDAYDRDRDNDGVSNRRDADRDGDGVRNDRDRRPDNPRRD